MATRNAPDDQAIIDAIAEHGSVSKACRDLKTSRSAFYARVAADKDLADKYARAKEFGIDNMMEELLDKPIEDASKDRLEWDRKRWHASKLFARKYGDKTLHGSDPDNPLPSGFNVNFSQKP